MKPHIRYKAGRWGVWRDRSACPWALPTVLRDTLKEAYEDHIIYLGGVPYSMDSWLSSSTHCYEG